MGSMSVAFFRLSKVSQYNENKGAFPVFCLGNGSELDHSGHVLVCKEALVQKYFGLPNSKQL